LKKLQEVKEVYLMNKALVEALKEAGRVVVIAIIPVVVPMITNWVIDWKVIATVGAITLLRFLDKFLHENAPEGTAGGLTRF
jgi:hypothetical protein